MRLLTTIAAWLVLALGLVHLLVGYRAFAEPTEARTWFASAGFLLVMIGLANLAVQAHPARLASAMGAVGAAMILVVGALLVAGDAAMLSQPQVFILLALGSLLLVQRLRELLGANARAGGASL